jgi:hypothetical protein
MSKKQFLINVVAFIAAWLALPFLLACDKGCEDHEGTCACDPSPAEQAASVAPSNEKPPQDKMPSYEREGIHADMPPSQTAQLEQEDKQKAQADFEGKKAAGLK